MRCCVGGKIYKFKKRVEKCLEQRKLAVEVLTVLTVVPEHIKRI